MSRTLILLVFSLFAWQFCNTAQGQSYSASSHGNKAQLPSGCATCHQGHGVASTPMLIKNEEEMCFTCHGSLSSRSTSIQQGKLSSGFIHLNDISLLLRKRYNHYASTKGTKFREGNEENTCSGCHNSHYTGSPNAFQGLRGMTLEGAETTQAQYEYEVCFECHSQEPGAVENTFRDIRLEFYSSVAASSHPLNHSVSALQSRSISLKDNGGEYQMSCSTCHGNSEPAGPRGIHGSDYPYLLKKNIEINDYIPESQTGAQLCYTCHDRNSIIGNESFTYHAEHLTGVFTATSCLTCHSGHGSISYPSMISFDPKIVGPTSTGFFSFEPTGLHSGVCYLNCHNAEHDGVSYQNGDELSTASEALHPFSPTRLRQFSFPKGKKEIRKQIRPPKEEKKKPIPE